MCEIRNYLTRILHYKSLQVLLFVCNVDKNLKISKPAPGNVCFDPINLEYAARIYLFIYFFLQKHASLNYPISSGSISYRPERAPRVRLLGRFDGVVPFPFPLPPLLVARSKERESVRETRQNDGNARARAQRFGSFFKSRRWLFLAGSFGF